MAQPPPIQEPAFDPVLYDIRHVMDIGLTAKAETFPTYTPKGWRSSSLGYCLQRQFAERAGVERDNSTSRTLWLGDLIHSGIQGLFRQSGLLLIEELALEAPDLHIQGHVDMIWGGEVTPFSFADYDGDSERWIAYLERFRDDLGLLYGAPPFPVTGTELKSANDYSARKAFGEGPQFHHKMQLGSYALMAQTNPEGLPPILVTHPVERWQLVVYSKTDMKAIVFPMAESWPKQAENRLGELNLFWDEQRIPPCTCGHDIGWEPGYCAYGDKAGPGGKNLYCCDKWKLPELIEEAMAA